MCVRERERERERERDVVVGKEGILAVSEHEKEGREGRREGERERR